MDAAKVHAVVFRTEDAAISRAARLAPRGLVVAHAHVVGTVQAVEACLHLLHHPGVALLREVAGHKDEVDAVCVVYLFDACQQGFGGTIAIRVQVDVGQLGEAEGLHLRHHEGGNEVQYKEKDVLHVYSDSWVLRKLEEGDNLLHQAVASVAQGFEGHAHDERAVVAAAIGHRVPAYITMRVVSSVLVSLPVAFWRFGRNSHTKVRRNEENCKIYWHKLRLSLKGFSFLSCLSVFTYHMKHNNI